VYCSCCKAVDAIKHKESANIDPWCGCPVTSSRECEQKERKKGGPERRDCAVDFGFPVAVAAFFRRAGGQVGGELFPPRSEKEIAMGIDRLLLESLGACQTQGSRAGCYLIGGGGGDG
ncbi:hypothetical protein QBC32DRAFT_207991, partial [Pseudoneurospora amorphoporcata]